MRAATASLCVFSLSLCLGCSGGVPPGDGISPSVEGYNLLLITVDTLRADKLGCYGHGGGLTPHIDALARDGLRFSRATCSVPVTLPSHASILTGLDPPLHGVRHNGTFRLADEHDTLAERLASAGYQTAAFVGAYVLDSHYGLEQGFSHYDDAVNTEGAAATDARYNERPANRVTDVALDWLATRDTARPFFVWAHYFDPHGPYAPPSLYRQRHPDPYDGEIAFTDAEIGRLIGGLRESGALARTLVVFTTDHGEALGDHGELTHGILLYEATMRVPLILSAPGIAAENTVVDDRVAGSIDVLPTVLTLLGVFYDDGAIDGVDLLDEARRPGRAVYIESLVPMLDHGWAPLHGLRRAGDKLILAPEPEYYDLDEDPGEENNLFSAREEARVLQSGLQDRMREWPAAAEVARAELPMTREQIERLASLGYVRAPAAGTSDAARDPKRMIHVAARINEALQLNASGRSREALEHIRGVLRENPDDGKAWYAAVRIHDRLEQYADAERSVRRALELSPRADGWVLLARYALARGDEAVFQDALRQAEAIEPEYGGIYIGRGAWLARQRRFDEALVQFEKALALDPVRSGTEARTQIERVREFIR